MRKRISLIIVIIVLTMSILTACETTKTTNLDGDLWGKFIVVEEYGKLGLGHLYIVYDKDTKVMYYIIGSDYKSGMTPIYNTDGTIKIYEGGE